jgi:hypothetical protein
MQPSQAEDMNPFSTVLFITRNYEHIRTDIDTLFILLGKKLGKTKWNGKIVFTKIHEYTTMLNILVGLHDTAAHKKREFEIQDTIWTSRDGLYALQNGNIAYLDDKSVIIHDMALQTMFSLEEEYSISCMTELRNGLLVIASYTKFCTYLSKWDLITETQSKKKLFSRRNRCNY